MAVDGGVVGEFRMKRRGEHVSLLHQRRFPFVTGEHFNALPHFLNDWPADENHLQRLFLQRAWAEKDVACQLAAVAVAQDCHVQQAQRFLRRIVHLRSQQNSTGARAENSSALPGKLSNRVKQAVFLQELQLRGRFSAGQNNAVAPFQICNGAHLYRLCAQRLQHRRMRRKIALYCNDSNLHRPILLSLLLRMTRPGATGCRRTTPGRFPSRISLPGDFGATLQSPPYQPRVESMSFSSSCRTSIPGIASPSSSHASRIAFGSSKCVFAFTIAFARASGSLLLKMPEPTNTASAPSLRTSAASAGVAMPPAEKFGTGSLPVFAISRSRSSGAPISFAVRINSSSRSVVSRFISETIVRMCRTASTTLPEPASPLVRIIAAPSAMRRTASPRLRAPQTNGTR